MNSDTRKTRVFKLMIGVFVALLLVGYGWTKGGKSDTATDAVKTDTAIASDEEQIKNLIVQMYKWKDQSLPGADFVPISEDSNIRYIGIDMDEHASRLEALTLSLFFSDEFLSTYDSIAKTIDGILKNEKIEWMVGDLPSFGTGVNPWCSCQDYSSENPWDSIFIIFDTINGESASLSWTWGSPKWAENFTYKVRAVKMNDGWRISHLQGFDYMNSSLK